MKPWGDTISVKAIILFWRCNPNSENRLERWLFVTAENDMGNKSVWTLFPRFFYHWKRTHVYRLVSSLRIGHELRSSSSANPISTTKTFSKNYSLTLSWDDASEGSCFDAQSHVSENHRSWLKKISVWSLSQRLCQLKLRLETIKTIRSCWLVSSLRRSWTTIFAGESHWTTETSSMCYPQTFSWGDPSELKAHSLITVSFRNLVTVANNRKLLSFEMMTFGVSINVSQEDERVPNFWFRPRKCHETRSSKVATKSHFRWPCFTHWSSIRKGYLLSGRFQLCFRSKFHFGKLHGAMVVTKAIPGHPWSADHVSQVPPVQVGVVTTVVPPGSGVRNCTVCTRRVTIIVVFGGEFFPVVIHQRVSRCTRESTDGQPVQRHLVTH